MSDLNSRERRKLEELLGMGSGYVLNFSDRTYFEFFDEFVGKNIDDERYRVRGTSKANRMRAFWEIEPNHTVAKALQELLAHARNDSLPINRHLVDECQTIITRLALDKPVADLDAIASDGEDRNFDLVAQAVRESIDKNQPEIGLDRLHLFVVKFVRSICEGHDLPHDRGIPLNGLFGGYVKFLTKNGHLTSDMTERILKSSIANLGAFDYVRNNHTLAHDNAILSYDEALLIFNHIASAVRFIKTLEDRIRPAPAPKKLPWEQDPVEF